MDKSKEIVVTPISHLKDEETEMQKVRNDLTEVTLSWKNQYDDSCVLTFKPKKCIKAVS